jgi:hypothetical protein
VSAAAPFSRTVPRAGPARRASRVARLPLTPLAVIGGLAASVGVRVTQLHDGLLYPDGYQYLLMARGIAEHGHPVTTLGPGGDQFVPSVDAAAKPLLPLLVAVADVLGLQPVTAARGLTALTAGAVVVLCALLARALTGSLLAAAVAGGLCLASPAIGHWAGFLGPDAPAQALVLAAALAATHRRPGWAGLLGGLAACARPELALVALAVGLAAAAARATRDDALLALGAALGIASAVHLAVRSPLPLPSVGLAAAGLAATAGVALALVAARRAPRLVAALATAGLALLLALRMGDAAGRSHAALLVLGALGVACCLRTAASARLVAPVVVVALALGTVYAEKNPGSDRYVSLLLPVACLAAGIAAGMRGRLAVRAGAGAAALTVAILLTPSLPEPGDDALAATAARLPRSSAALVTAAPDAYGFLLPDRPVHALRAGARGEVLLDGAQRLYTPRVTVRGMVVARIEGVPFARPDGSLDRGPARVVDGVVVAAR